MEFKFSKNLILRTIAYFKKKYNKDISSEVANEYLNSFSRLFLAFAHGDTATPHSGVAVFPCEINTLLHSQNSP